MHPLKHWRLQIPLLVLLCWMVACSQEVDLTLWQGNAFSATLLTTTRVDADPRQTVAEVTQTLDAQVSAIRSQPHITRATWRRLTTDAAEFKAQVTIEGDDYTALENMVAGAATVRTVVQDGAEAVEFIYTSAPTTAYTLTLHSGTVLSTNGNRLDDSTVQWNAGVMNAVVRPKARASGTLPLVMGGALLMLLLLALLGFALQSRGVHTAPPL